MRALILLGGLTFFFVTIVMAAVFRDKRAKGRIQFLMKLGWGYVIAIVLLALWRIYDGGL